MMMASCFDGHVCVRRFTGYVVILAMLCLCGTETWGIDSPPVVESRRGMVVSVSPDASDAGIAILNAGGNAVDAAVAVAFALAVTFPEAGNIGGGGFMMVWPGHGSWGMPHGDKQLPVCIDYRETSPAKLDRDSFVNEKRLEGHHTVGVPGTVRGLSLAHEKFGRLPWKQILAPAIRLAAEGFPVDDALASALNRMNGAPTDSFPEFRRVFSKQDGSEWKAGDRLIQPDLAQTLQVIADEGADSFYHGRIAKQILAEIEAGNGAISQGDLGEYRAILREPVHTTYRGHDVYAPPPPSAGGTQLIECLNILEQFDLAQSGPKSVRTGHLLAEAMRRAACDRSRFGGDPGFTQVPSRLVSKEYGRELSDKISLSHATPSEMIAPEIKLVDESSSTTHFSVADGNGMAVSNTYTLQNSYGSRVVVRGAGFLLNNEMTDFNWRPGVTTRQGKVGTEANVIAGGKRMVSSQCPTFVAKNGQLLLVTGSPGGRTIPSTVLCIVTNVIDFKLSVRDAVDSQRWHHQWFPDRLQLEARPDSNDMVLISELSKLGHVFGNDVKRLGDGYSRQGDAHTIMIQDGVLMGAADWRRTKGKAAGR